MRTASSILLVFWLLPGWLIGLAVAAHTALVNQLAPPIDANAGRLLVAAAAAGALQGLAAGLLVTVSIRLAGAIAKRPLSSAHLHFRAALAIWGAWLLLAPTLQIGTQSPGLVLAMRVGALAWLVGAPVLAGAARRWTAAWVSTLISRRILSAGAAVLAALTVGLFALQVIPSSPAPDFGEAGAARETAAQPDALGPSFAPLPEGLPREGGGRVFLIGIDGLGWDLLGSVIQAGDAPNLASLSRRGVWGELETLLPTWSPRIWNTVFTGRSPEEHGIETFSSVAYPRLDVTGLENHRSLMVVKPVLDLFDRLQRVPTSSLSRRVKAIWNLASEAGLEVVAVAPWASYPAEAVNGVLVSDHAFYRPKDFSMRMSGRRVDRTDRFLTHPPSLAAELARFQRTIEDVGPEILEPFVDFQPGDRERFRERVVQRFVPGSKPRFRMLTWHFLNDAYTAESTLHLLEQLAPDLLFTYLNAPDAFAHMVWEFGAPGASEHQDPVEVARYGNTMHRIVSWVDGAVGRILQHADANTSIIVVSDHGWQREGTSNGKPLYNHNDAPPGIFLAAGRGLRRAGRIEGVRIVDIAPTLLYLLGLPLSDELEGPLLDEAIDPDLLVAHPPRHVPTYEAGRSVGTVPRHSGQDGEMLERLEALGYLE